MPTSDLPTVGNSEVGISEGNRLHINAHRAIIDSARIRGRKTQEEGAPTRPRTPCKLNSSHENRGARLRDACAKLVWDFQVVPNIICKSVNLLKWFCTRCWMLREWANEKMIFKDCTLLARSILKRLLHAWLRA